MTALLFLANDNVPKARNLRGMAVRDQDEISETAMTRLRELLADMGWDEDTAIEEIYEEFGKPLDIGKKAIENWFLRNAIPPAHIFNLSTFLGVAAGWIAGQPGLEKEDAIQRGLYLREVERNLRPRPRRRPG